MVYLNNKRSNKRREEEEEDLFERKEEDVVNINIQKSYRTSLDSPLES